MMMTIQKLLSLFGMNARDFLLQFANSKHEPQRMSLAVSVRTYAERAKNAQSCQKLTSERNERCGIFLVRRVGSSIEILVAIVPSALR